MAGWQNAASRRLRFFCAALACTACGTEAPRAAEGAGRDTTIAEVTAVFGEVEGAEEFLFGDVRSVAMGPDGLVYVADRQPASVRAFTPAGDFVGWVGREGDGPGEFRWPTDLVFDSEGRLHARDIQRITIFAPAAEGALPDSVLRTLPLPGFGNTAAARAATDGTNYYYPSYLFRPGVPDEYFYLPFDSTGTTGDTVRVSGISNVEFARRAFVRLTPNSGRMIEGVNRAPFEPVASWAITAEGTILASPGDAYRVLELDGDGDTLRVLAPGDVRPRPVPEAEARDSADAFRARIDSLPVPVDDVEGMSPLARAGALPDRLPEVLAVYPGAGGRVWVRRWPDGNAGSTTTFDVLGPGGDIERSVVVPSYYLQAEPPPHVTAAWIVGVVEDPATAVHRIAVFRVPEEVP
jgi:hypothetical protein